LPYAFTEHGAIMAAMVLNSPSAVAMSVQVVRVFVRLREMLGTHKDLVFKSSLMLSGNSWYFWNMFYRAQTLLLPRNIRRSTHAGVIATFNQQFILNGNIPNVRRHYGRRIATR
jgi:uncharacterized protein (UPF0332 family)